MTKYIILDLCSGSGAWSQPYRDKNYTVICLDLQDGQDIRLHKKENIQVQGILAAPPCTHLCSSGARWWKEKGESKLIESLSIVDACLRLVVLYKPVWWALENPLGRLTSFLGKPKIKFQPWEYGDPYTKQTCLWGNFNIPEKNPVEPVEGGKIWNMSPSSERTALRSITPAGFAKAFAAANP